MDTEPRSAPTIQTFKIPERTKQFNERMLNMTGRLKNQRERKLALAKDKLRRDLFSGAVTPATRLMERQIRDSKPLLVRY